MGGAREMVLWSARFSGGPEGDCQRIHLSRIQNMHEDCEKERGKTPLLKQILQGHSLPNELCFQRGGRNRKL